MSTRCQVLFTGGDTQLLTYKHFDGYPSEVIPLLRDYWRWYPRTERLEYLTATWFYYCKRQKERNSVKLDWCDAPMATDELDHNHPVALSYGICADGEIHDDTEHFYQVDIQQETVAHYTPNGWSFESADSPADITVRDPDETYRLTASDAGERDGMDDQSDSRIVTDGGTRGGIGESDTQQVTCSRCGRTRDVTHTAESGTPAGDYFGLRESSKADVCSRCWSRLPETISENGDFDLPEFDGWERQITADDSRFVSSIWQSGSHTVTLDTVGCGEWTVSWFGADDDWHSRYDVWQYALNQIQQMVQIIEIGVMDDG